MTDRLTGEASLVEPGRGLVWVVGPDARTFLQGVVSQDVEAPASGSVVRSFLLGPQGKLRALLWLAVGDGEVAIVCDDAERVADDLGRYKIRVKSQIHVEPGPTWEVWGPGAAAALGVGDAGWTRRGEDVAIPLGRSDRWLGTGSAPALPTLGAEARTAVRIFDGEPRFGVDIDESVIPQETGLVDQAVSFTKGCYLGQELVARIDTRGHVNRRLCRLVFHGGLPGPGSTLVLDGDPVGVVGSVAEMGDQAVGLGLVHRRVDDGDEVGVEASVGITAAVHPLDQR